MPRTMPRSATPVALQFVDQELLFPQALPVPQPSWQGSFGPRLALGVPVEEVQEQRGGCQAASHSAMMVFGCPGRGGA